MKHNIRMLRRSEEVGFECLRCNDFFLPENEWEEKNLRVVRRRAGKTRCNYKEIRRELRGLPAPTADVVGFKKKSVPFVMKPRLKRYSVPTMPFYK